MPTLNRRSSARTPAKHFLAGLCILALIGLVPALPALAPPVRAATDTVILDSRQTAEVAFGQTIVFTLETPWEKPPPAQVTLLFGLPHGASRSLVHVRSNLARKLLTAEHIWEIGDSLVPGADLEFHWRIKVADGSSYSTRPSIVVYEDSSLPWSRIGDGRVEIVWHEGGEAFGNKALAAAQAALGRLKESFGAELERSTRIVLYADVARMRRALGGGTSPWVAAQAIAPFNVVVLYAPPDSSELEVLIAHELTHIVVEQVTRNPFSGPPAWIHEGLATYIESTGAPRFDYDGILKEAIENDSLISLRGLTATFPAKGSGAILAYAESNSLMRFVIDRYGSDAVRRLLETYRQGVTDDEAVRLALGLGLSELESSWLEHIGATAPLKSGSATSAPALPGAAEIPTAAAPSASAPDDQPEVTPAGTVQAPSTGAAEVPAQADETVAGAAPVNPTAPAAPQPQVASQIAPPTDAIRNVAVGTVIVIALLLAFVFLQFRRARSRK